MLTIFLSFCYVFVLSFSYGNAISACSKKITGYGFRYLSSFLWAGIGAFAVYAQLFSLLSGVGIWANIILVLGGLILCYLCFDSLKRNAKQFFTVWRIVGLLVLALIFSFGGSRGYSHYDTALYHSQAIRWVEEYGVVKGLGLLHNRLAYNSAAFPLSALFSFSFINKLESMHEMAAFFAYVLSLELLDWGGIFKRKKILLSDVFRLGIFYYLSLVFDEVVSPASDYFVMSVVFYIILVWIRLFESEEKNAVPYGWVCILSVFACTIKFSACVIILLTLFPIVKFVKERKYKLIGLFFCCGLLVALPFFIRNIIISGRLLYPSTALDIFSVDWKIPEEIANLDRMEIIAWGRGINRVDGYYATFCEWFPTYFSSQSIMIKLLFMLDGVGLLCGIVFGCYCLFKRKRENYMWLFLVFVLYLCLFVWLFSSPLVRYGYVYLICPSLVTLGFFVVNRKTLEKIVLVLGAVFIAWKGYEIAKYVYSVRVVEYYIYQQPYEQYEVEAVPLGNEVIYVPKEGDQTGYYFFPSTPNIKCILRGENLKEGFRLER